MDLAITAGVMILCAAVCYRVSREYSFRSPIKAQFLLGLIILLAIWLTWTTGSRLSWARVIPHGSVVLLANTSLILLAGGAGLISGANRLSALRKRLVVFALTSSATCFVAAAVLRPLWNPLVLPDEGAWREGVCLQTHEASCAPAAAATLLRLHGIPSDERKMAKECLSSGGGTMTLGVFRGIYRATQRVWLRAKAVVGNPEEYPQNALEAHVPMIALVNFTPQLRGDWIPSAAQRRSRFSLGSLDYFAVTGHNDGQHAVVLLERLPSGDWLVADPAVGRTRWSNDYFRSIWIGEGIYLAPR